MVREDYARTKPVFWKTSSPSSAPAIREGQWKLHLNRKRDHGIQLYDLSNDPSESRNVAAENPKVVARLKKQLRAWVAELPSEYDKGEER